VSSAVRFDASWRLIETDDEPRVSSAVRFDAPWRLIETDDEPRSGTQDRDREASPTNHRLTGEVDPLCIGDLYGAPHRAAIRVASASADISQLEGTHPA
jgi:hypothetical protein